MKRGSATTFLLLSLLCAVASVRETVAVSPSAKPAFNFNAVDYFHRWSKGTNTNSRPRDRRTSKKWADMITLNGYPDVRGR